MPSKQSAVLKQAVEASFSKSSTVLVELHDKLLDMEAKNASITISRGAVPPTMQSKFEQKKKQCALLPCSAVHHTR